MPYTTYAIDKDYIGSTFLNNIIISIVLHHGVIQWRCCPGTQKMLAIDSGVSAMKFRDWGRTYTIQHTCLSPDTVHYIRLASVMASFYFLKRHVYMRGYNVASPMQPIRYNKSTATIPQAPTTFIIETWLVINDMYWETSVEFIGPEK